MKKFIVSFSIVQRAEITALDLQTAEKLANEVCAQNKFKLLSILEEGAEIEVIKESEPEKTPPPFGKPPGGTLGGGQMKVEAPLVDQIAEAA